MSKTSHFQIGVASIAFAAFLYFFAIPNWVTSPSNIQNIVLSPTFWPNIISGLLAIGGLGMMLTSRRLTDDNHETFFAGTRGAIPRLLACAILMVIYVWVSEYIGLVWASMLAFAAMAFIIKTGHPKSALVAAVIVPLILYLFFAHVAGVAVPQGEFVRLP